MEIRESRGRSYVDASSLLIHFLASHLPPLAAAGFFRWQPAADEISKTAMVYDLLSISIICMAVSRVSPPATLNSYEL